jgi:hypothetical protein
MAESYRVFRAADDELVYIGTYGGASPKEATKKAADDDPAPAGEHVYEAHVTRNASLFRIKNRDERFTDDVRQLNTQDEMSGVLEGSEAEAKLIPAQKSWATRRAKGDDGTDAAAKAIATRKRNERAAEAKAKATK